MNIGLLTGLLAQITQEEEEEQQTKTFILDAKVADTLIKPNGNPVDSTDYRVSRWQNHKNRTISCDVASSNSGSTFFVYWPGGMFVNAGYVPPCLTGQPNPMVMSVLGGSLSTYTLANLGTNNLNSHVIPGLSLVNCFVYFVFSFVQVPVYTPPLYMLRAREFPDITTNYQEIGILLGINTQLRGYILPVPGSTFTAGVIDSKTCTAHVQRWVIGYQWVVKNGISEPNSLTFVSSNFPTTDPVIWKRNCDMKNTHTNTLFVRVGNNFTRIHEFGVLPYTMTDTNMTAFVKGLGTKWNST